MRKTVLALTLAASALPVSAEGWTDAAARPAYHAIETVSDRVYGLMRGDLFTPLLPGRLSQKMSSVPSGDSYSAFTAELRRRQERAARRDAESLQGVTTPQAQTEWRRRALTAHREAALDALAHTLLGRYQLDRFGKDSGEYAKHGEHWDREFLTSGLLLGGAYAYFAGVRAGWNAGPAHIGLDLRPGQALRSSIENGSGAGLASLRVSPRGTHLTLRTDWGLHSGRAQAQRVGLSYSNRF